MDHSSTVPVESALSNRIDMRFLDLYDRMLGAASLEDVLTQVRNVVNSAMGAEATTVYLIRHDTEELVATAIVHNVSRLIRMPIRETSLAGYCAVSGTAFLVEDAYGDLSGISPTLRFDRSWDDAHLHRTRDVLCAPAVFKQEVIGVVQVLNSRGKPFDQDDLAALSSISRLVGYALHQARVYDDLMSLRHLQREKARFMRIMVHELKSPLSAARMLLHVLERGLADPERRERIVDRISSRLDSLLEMIQEVLQLSKLSGGGAMGPVAAVDLCAMVPTWCESYRDQATAKGLEFRVDVAEEAVSVHFDTQALQLVVSNLVSNGVKYTTQGHVTVRVQRQDGAAEVAVEDTGMGIPEADVPQLFKDFFRASNARRAKVEGTGVGLSSIKAVVERFGGELMLDTRENAGSTFRVRLPLATATAAEASPLV